MPSLGETTAILARLRRTANTGAAAASRGGALRHTVTFGSNPGALRMLSYAPVTLPHDAPLVVVLHGCTQSAEDYAVSAGWIALADQLGFAVLAPEQVAANNPNRCFNWFEPGDTARGAGEAASIAAMVAAMVRDHDCDPARVFITGLSAGGAMTAVMLATYPELFAGGAIIAGLPYGVARGVPDALRVMGRGDGRAPATLGKLVDRGQAGALRLAIWQGDADYTVNAANAHDLAGQWTSTLNLPQAPVEATRLAKRTRSTWGGDEAGSVVELNIVHGLGHGAPLSTRSEGDVGAPGPYMLEAGLCSTRQIAAFWRLGLLEMASASPSSGSAAAPPSPRRQPETSGGEEPSGVAAQVLQAVSGHVPPEVRDVIAKALRSAGLTR